MPSPIPDRDEVEGHLVGQPRVRALPGDGAAGDGDEAAASEALCVSDCGCYRAGHEGAWCLGVCVGPVGRDPVRPDGGGNVEGVPARPARGHLAQRPAADQCAG